MGLKKLMALMGSTIDKGIERVYGAGEEETVVFEYVEGVNR